MSATFFLRARLSSETADLAVDYAELATFTSCCVFRRNDGNPMLTVSFFIAPRSSDGYYLSDHAIFEMETIQTSLNA